jgi:hypothetical protein
MRVDEGLGARVVVGDVRHWWMSSGFPCDQGGAELAQRSDLCRKVWWMGEVRLKGTPDLSVLVTTAPTGVILLLGGATMDLSPICYSLQVKTWSGSLGQTTTGSVLRNLAGDVVFKTLGRFLLLSHLCALVLHLGGVWWRQLGCEPCMFLVVVCRRGPFFNGIHGANGVPFCALVITLVDARS